jgi:RHS repeat-associated protein
LGSHHFTGQLHDQESGNEYFNARYYSNGTGRFLSPDPSGLVYADPTNPQSLNLYAYALNNPLRFIDPTGMILCDYGSSDQGGEDFEDADSSGECTSNGGTVSTDQQSVTVNANGSSSPSLIPYQTTVTLASVGVTGMLLTSQHCQQVFSKVIPGYSNQAFLDNNGKTPAYMVPAVLGPDPSTWGDIASTPQSYIGGSPDEDVGTRFYRSSVDAYTTPDYSSVVVGPNFFSIRVRRLRYFSTRTYTPTAR